MRLKFTLSYQIYINIQHLLRNKFQLCKSFWYIDSVRPQDSPADDSGSQPDTDIVTEAEPVAESGQEIEREPEPQQDNEQAESTSQAQAESKTGSIIETEEKARIEAEAEVPIQSANAENEEVN